MAVEFITPIQITSLKDKGSVLPKQTEADQESLFGSIFSEAVKNVESTQKDLENKQYLLATGQIDDAHTVPIAIAEAQLSVDLLVSLRNKAMESYNELMRINL